MDDDLGKTNAFRFDQDRMQTENMFTPGMYTEAFRSTMMQAAALFSLCSPFFAPGALSMTAEDEGDTNLIRERFNCFRIIMHIDRVRKKKRKKSIIIIGKCSLEKEREREREREREKEGGRDRSVEVERNVIKGEAR